MAAASEEMPPLSPIKKNKRGQVVHKNQKVIVVNLYKKLKEDNPQMSYEDTILTLMGQTGIGKNTMKKIIAEYNRTGQVTEPNLKKARPTFKEKINESHKNAIRRKVHEFYRNNELPTVDKILQVVNDDEDLPQFKRSTFHKLLHELNFVYK